MTFHKNASPSGYGQLDVGNGGAAIRSAIETCAAGNPIKIGDTLDTKPGNTLGPERQGVDFLMTVDPDRDALNASEWRGPGHHDQDYPGRLCGPSGTCSCNGSAANCPYGGLMSPRIAQVALCSVTEASCAAGGPSNSSITVTNIMSFFITDYQSGDIHAILIGSSGELVPGGGAGPGPTGTFITVTRLVR